MDKLPNTPELARILFVDDDEAYSALCARYLKKDPNINFEVVGVKTAAEALRVCVEQEFDCLIIDYQLPDVTGTNLISTLNEVLRRSMPPAIVLTAGGGVEAAAEAVRANASDFLTKSNVSVASLCRAVGNAVEKGHLNRAVLESNEKLNVAYKELQRNATEIENFYHTVSHEVKTPLTAIQQFLSLIKDEVVGPITEQQEELLGYSLESTEQIATHFNDLLDLARLESKKLKLNKEWDTPSRLVTRCVRGVEGMAKCKGVGINIVTNKDDKQIKVDVNRIVQVLSNLLNNAINHSDEGAPIEVKHGLCADNTYEIKVIDSGCGIELSDHDRIFDRLYQINSKDDCARNGGLGLGLSIAREIMLLHNGDLLVESQLGLGSTFTMQLPVDSA